VMRYNIKIDSMASGLQLSISRAEV
jgi:hypothetical protein